MIINFGPQISREVFAVQDHVLKSGGQIVVFGVVNFAGGSYSKI